MAVPIFGADGDVVAGITLAGPSDRIEARQDFLEVALREAGQRATALLAGRPALPFP
jgi:DNA-binding IclR family transcriptional regulator